MTDPAARFAIIQLAPDQPPPPGCIMWGSFDTIMERVSDSTAHNDALREERSLRARVDALRQQEQQISSRSLRATLDTVDKLTQRMDDITAAKRQARAKAAADEAARIEALLDAMPDPDAEVPAFYPPDGHLHSIAAQHPDTDNEGDLPAAITRATPPPLGTDPQPDPAELAYPATSQYRSPAAVSLNEDDY